MIYEHGEQWWNDNDREKLLIRPPERTLAILPDSNLVENQEELGEGNYEFCLQNISFIFVEFLNMPLKFSDMRSTALLPFRREVYCGFLSPLKMYRLGPFLTRELCVQLQAL
jgi:hypothetical protein